MIIVIYAMSGCSFILTIGSSHCLSGRLSTTVLRLYGSIRVARAISTSSIFPTDDGRRPPRRYRSLLAHRLLSYYYCKMRKSISTHIGFVSSHTSPVLSQYSCTQWRLLVKNPLRLLLAISLSCRAVLL